MTQSALRKIGNENAFIVHDEGNSHFGFDLPQNIPNYRVQKKLSKFVLNWSDSLALKARIVALVFFCPKGPDEWVFDLPNHSGAICIIGEEAVAPQQRCVSAIEKG